MTKEEALQRATCPLCGETVPAGELDALGNRCASCYERAGEILPHVYKFGIVLMRAEMRLTPDPTKVEEPTP